MMLSNVFNDDSLTKPKSYQQRYTFEQRSEESKRIMEKYPNRLPIIVEKSDQCSEDIPNIDKNKYLVPDDLTVGQFLYVIRKRIRLPSTKALYITTSNGLMPPSSQHMKNLYNKYKDPDQFMYIKYSGESTFG
jgi:GABA(A) receptor-associated protein